MENTEIFEMADRLKSLQEQKKDLEAQTKALTAEIAELDEQLSNAMTEAELDRFSRNGSFLSVRLYGYGLLPAQNSTLNSQESKIPLCLLQ